jgi:hypothetical protein
MARLVKEFIDVTDQGTLDQLIERLMTVRNELPSDSQAQVRMRGDDVFGRKLSISFQRPQTAEEAECDARYAHAYRDNREREQSRVDAEAIATGQRRPPRGGRLRMVA